MENKKEKKETGVSAPGKKKMISLEDLFRKSFEDYKKNFSKIAIFLLIPLAASFLFLILMSVLTFGMIGAGRISGESGTLLGVGIMGIVFMIVGVVFLIAVNLIATAGMFIVFRDSHENLTAKEIFSRARKNVIGYLGVSILTGILVMIWTLALIIPGIIFAVYYMFSVWVFFKEGKRGMSAIRRSQEIIKNYWWAVVGRLFLVIFAIFIIYSLLQQVLPNPIGPFIANIISWFAGPFLLVYQFHMYKSLVGIKGQTEDERMVISETESVNINQQ